MANQEHNEVPINTAPINKFIQNVKQADNDGSREVKIKTHDAKRLSFVLTEILSRLNEDLEEIVVKQNENTSSEEFEIKIDGGNNW